IRRVRAPPSLPVRIGPRTAHRSEHVPTHDPGANLAESARGEIVVGSRGAALVAEHLPKRAGRERPVVQRHPAGAKRALEALVGTGTEPVDRNAEALNTQLAHLN